MYFPLVVSTELIGGVVKVMCGHYVTLIILAHAEPIDRQLLTILVSGENCQLDCLAVFHNCLLELKPVAAQPPHI